MLDNDVPKHKAKLTKLTLDMDSARTRYWLCEILTAVTEDLCLLRSDTL
jgi:hypothetical protein